MTFSAHQGRLDYLKINLGNQAKAVIPTHPPQAIGHSSRPHAPRKRLLAEPAAGISREASDMGKNGCLSAVCLRASSGTEAIEHETGGGAVGPCQTSL
jgi:hypothetical protein